MRGLDETLRDSVVIGVITEDAARYLRILLTDQRGWNIRNTLCHGILPADSFGQEVADRVIHALIILAAVRESKQG